MENELETTSVSTIHDKEICSTSTKFEELMEAPFFFFVALENKDVQNHLGKQFPRKIL